MNKTIQFKVGLFLLTAVLVSAFAFIYLLYERGWFEHSTQYTLIAPNAENIDVGMPLNFRGIPIGKVSSLSLTPLGMARIIVNVDSRQSQWLRASSQFSLDKPLVGAAKIRVDVSELNSPLLNPNKEYPLNLGNGGVDVPALTAKANIILDQFGAVAKNVAYMTRRDSEINVTLSNAKAITQQMTGKYGVAQGLLGSEKNAQSLIDSLQNTRQLTANLNQLSLKLDHSAFAKGGLMDKANQSVAELHLMLEDIRTSLKKVDELLVNTTGLTANLKQGTDDMGQLRSEVDEALSKTNQLITKINRYLPSGKAGEVKLP
ncbi:MlaD family protein [Sulfuriferula thiophila]|uniref:MlaD family protein n=1 Tax=Sulfuriferula thiophila TaxID=1781211 RepID=UPI000F607FD8|nr:MlaD family protein [Sulfuriferula thiophila]